MDGRRVLIQEAEELDALAQAPAHHFAVVQHASSLGKHLAQPEMEHTTEVLGRVRESRGGQNVDMCADYCDL